MGVYEGQAELDLKLRYWGPSWGWIMVHLSASRNKWVKGAGACHVTQLEKDIKFYYYVKTNSAIL